jgi:hypothetical protein
VIPVYQTHFNLFFFSNIIIQTFNKRLVDFLKNISLKLVVLMKILPEKTQLVLFTFKFALFLEKLMKTQRAEKRKFIKKSTGLRSKDLRKAKNCLLNDC